MDFAEKIKELREEKGLSQQQLANELKISQSAIAKWELSKTQPTAKTLLLVAKYFDVSLEFLLDDEDAK